MTTHLNQLALVRTATARYQAAVTIRIESGDTCSLLILGDEADWEDSVPAAYFARMFVGIAKGTAVGQWQPVPVTAEISEAIATAVASVLTDYATADYVDGAVAGLAETSAVTAAIAAAVSGLASSASVAAAIAGACAVPAAGGSVSSPALATSYHPSATRPTRVNVYLDVALPSALLAAQSATVQLQAGPSTNPSTVVAGPQTPSSGVGNVGTLTIPVTLSYDLPAGHYYQVVKAAGTGTPTIARIEETAL